MRDPGEERLQGWTLFLDLNRDGELNAGEPQQITDTNGDYSFTGLAAGTHRVVEVVQEGWIATSPLSKDVFVDVNKKTRSDFYVFGGGDISGVVWNDQDNDGFRAQDQSQAHLQNRTGELDDLSRPQSKQRTDTGEPSTLTDAEGAFRFEDFHLATMKSPKSFPLVGTRVVATAQPKP